MTSQDFERILNQLCARLEKRVSTHGVFGTSQELEAAARGELVILLEASPFNVDSKPHP